MSSLTLYSPEVLHVPSILRYKNYVFRAQNLFICFVNGKFKVILVTVREGP
jgi:hypothetical protein